MKKILFILFLALLASACSDDCSDYGWVEFDNGGYAAYFYITYAESPDVVLKEPSSKTGSKWTGEFLPGNYIIKLGGGAAAGFQVMAGRTTLIKYSGGFNVSFK